MNKFLKKSVLTAVATASLVTVANFGNFNSNNVANAKVTENPLTTDWTNENTSGFSTWINKNAAPTTMPVYKVTNPINNNAYYRQSNKKLYFEGVPVSLDSDGSLSPYPNSKWMKAMEKPSFWKNHPEFNMLRDGISYAVPTKYRNAYSSGGMLVNVESMYKQVYHVNLNKLLTVNKPKNQYKYFKKGMNPSKYMVKGYNADVIRQVRVKALTQKGYVQSLFDHKVHNVYLKDQRGNSKYNDFSNKTFYRRALTYQEVKKQNQSEYHSVN